MIVSSVLLMVMHLVIAYTPVYDFIAIRVIGAPGEIIEPARTGLMIAVPWTWAIANRRFNQGILIRFGASRAISVGTALRLIANAAVLAIGYTTAGVQGAVVGTAALIAGVLTEAVFIWVRTRRVLRERLIKEPPLEEQLSFSTFSRFYIPLALTSLLTLMIQPLGSAALSRMPQALESLATWPVVFGLLFMLRSFGIAYKEVVVAMLDRPDPLPALRRFTAILALLTAALTVLITATPLADLWFRRLLGLSPSLTELARTGLWFGVLLPIFGVLQNWYVGFLVHIRRTHSITESVVVFLATCTLTLWIGVRWGEVPGLYIGVTAFTIGSCTQLGWVWWRSRQAFRERLVPD